MEYRRLRGTNVEVSRIALGCGCFGGIGSAPEFFGLGESDEEAFAIMDAACELGITLFDTADAYGGGRSETAIGRWLRSRGARDRIVLTTKVYHSVTGDPRDRGLSRPRILRQIDGSLERLGVERIDLYMIHEPDPLTSIEETLGAMDTVVRAGKVGAVGASNIAPRQLEEALRASESRGLARFGWIQESYSLLDRSIESHLIPLCDREGLGLTTFSPLAGGWLTGKYRRGTGRPAGSRMGLRPDPYRRYENEGTWRFLDTLEETSRQRGVSMAAVALAWLLAEPRVDAVIVGPRRPDHLDPVREALGLRLSADERLAISSLSGAPD